MSYIQHYLFLVKIVRKLPMLRSFLWKMRTHYHALRYKIFVGHPIVDGGPLLEAAILEKKPYAAGKMGSTEAAGAKTFLSRKNKKAKGTTPPSYPPPISITPFFVNSGVYPESEETYDRFYPVYLDAVQNCDTLVTWNVAGEVEVFNACCPKTNVMALYSIEPFFSKCVWTRALKNKKVLVISPFVDSIAKQYPKHNELWDIPGLLPDFELITLRAPLSAALVSPDSANWFEALEKMKAQMDGLDYDVALIGAGAYSLPLASHAKSRGKVGIHLGGNLQFLFGIYGSRWEAIEDYRVLIKSNWCRPGGEEKPPNTQINEGGCYW